MQNKPPDENEKKKSGKLQGNPYENVVPIAPGTTVPTAPKPLPWPALSELFGRLGSQGPRLPTGFQTLDKGWRGGAIMGKRWAILGAPGAGKTTLAVQLAHRWAEQGIPVIYVANDEPRDDILTRIGQQHGVHRDWLEGGQETAKRTASEHVQPLPLWILDPDEDEGVEVESTLNEARRRYPDGPLVVVLDSIQTLAANVPDLLAEGPRAKVDHVLKACKVGARKHRLLVIFLSEMNRGAYRFKGESPTEDIAAGKESGGIEYGADMLCLIRNVPKGDGMVCVTFPKSRLGKVEPFGLKLHADSAMFHEVPLPESAQPPEAQSPEQSFEKDCEEVLACVRANPGIGGAGPAARHLHRDDHVIRSIFQELNRLGRIVNRGTKNRPEWHVAEPPESHSEGVVAL